MFRSIRRALSCLVRRTPAAAATPTPVPARPKPAIWPVGVESGGAWYSVWPADRVPWWFPAVGSPDVRQLTYRGQPVLGVAEQDVDHLIQAAERQDEVDRKADEADLRDLAYAQSWNDLLRAREGSDIVPTDAEVVAAMRMEAQHPNG